MKTVAPGLELYGRTEGGLLQARSPIEGSNKMKFGRDFFKILGFVIQIMRMFAGCFGDDEDKQEVLASKKRSESSDPDEVC